VYGPFFHGVNTGSNPVGDAKSLSNMQGLSFSALRWSTVKAVSPQEFNGSPNVKDDEFEGDEQAHTPMKGNVTAPFGRHANTHKIALEISLCLFKRSRFTWLEPLPVTQEATLHHRNDVALL
jgi:hypothetical protein